MRRFLHTLLVALLIAGLGLPANAEQFIGGASQPQLTADLITSLEYKGTPTGGTATFTRGSARVFEDWEGNYVRTTNVNEAVFKARRVANLLAADSSEDFSVASWGTTSATVASNGDGSYRVTATGATANIRQAVTVSSGDVRTFRNSIWIKRASGTGTISLMDPNLTAVGVPVTSSWVRYSVADFGLASSANIRVIISTSGDAVDVKNAQLEEVTGQSITAPSEYRSTHQYYGGQPHKGVDFLAYENGNTVDANGVVTEAQGEAIPEAQLTGYQYDGASTNKIAGAYNAVGPDMLSTTNIYASYDFTSGWSASSATINDANTFTTTGANGKIYKTGSTNTGKRYRLTVAGTVSTGVFEVRSPSTGALYMTGFGTVDFTADATIGPLLQTATSGAVVDITALTLYEIGAANLAGTFVSGLGTGAKNTAAATAAIPGQTHGGTGSTTVTDVSAVITNTNKYKRLTPATKWYVTTASGGDATVDFTGALSAATHTLSLVAYGATASDVLTLGTNTVGGTPQTVTTAPVLYSQTLTANASDTMRLTVADGDTITWCLMQAETGYVPTSRIVVEGAAASRSRDNLTIPVADGTNFRQREGTVSVDITWGFGSASIPVAAYVPIFSLSNRVDSILYLQNSAGTVYLRNDDSTNAPFVATGAFVTGDTDALETTWSVSKNKLRTKFNATWSSATAYDGSYNLGTSWVLSYNGAYPFALKNLRVLGTADPGGM